MSLEGNQRRLPAGRKADLAQFIASHGQVTVAQLSQQFDVSIDTVRRDLDQLHAEGVITRTYGGAISAQPVFRSDQGLKERTKLNAPAKEQVAELAAALIPDGSVVIINSGTTTLALARHLRHHRDLTIATNNLLLPAEISPKALRDLYMFGGSVRTVTQATTGPVSLRIGQTGGDIDVSADIALIAIGAVNSEGYSTSNLPDAAMMAAMMDHAQRVIVLADSSKFDRRLFAKVSDVGRADYFVTDNAPEGELLDALRDGGVEIITPKGEGDA